MGKLKNLFRKLSATHCIISNMILLFLSIYLSFLSICRFL